jgi:hypothetical protein
MVHGGDQQQIMPAVVVVERSARGGRWAAAWWKDGCPETDMPAPILSRLNTCTDGIAKLRTVDRMSADAGVCVKENVDPRRFRLHCGAIPIIHLFWSSCAGNFRRMARQSLPDAHA